MNDSVNHPSHYTDGKFEVIDFLDEIEADFCVANAIKYISRAGKKDPTKEKEDLQKAIWYINHDIEKGREKAYFTKSIPLNDYIADKKISENRALALRNIIEGSFLAAIEVLKTEVEALP